MRAAGPAKTLFTSPRWDYRFWVLTLLKRHWRWPERKRRTVGSRLSSLRLTRSSWSVWGARLRRCWTADCSTPSTATSEPDTCPHPVTQAELRAAFSPSNGWEVAAIEPDRIQTRFHGDHGAPAWFGTIKRISCGPRKWR